MVFVLVIFVIRIVFWNCSFTLFFGPGNFFFLHSFKSVSSHIFFVSIWYLSHSFLSGLYLSYIIQLTVSVTHFLWLVFVPNTVKKNGQKGRTHRKTHRNLGMVAGMWSEFLVIEIFDMYLFFEKLNFREHITPKFSKTEDLENRGSRKPRISKTIDLENHGSRNLRISKTKG